MGAITDRRSRWGHARHAMNQRQRIFRFWAVGLVALLHPPGVRSQEKIVLQGISESQCHGLGGAVTEVTRTVAACAAGHFSYGNVIGMMCPCICCGPIPLETARSTNIPGAFAEIPAADPQLFKRVKRAAKWKNPRLVIRPLGTDIIGVGYRIQPNDMAGALARLPKKKWPYGRAVALQEVAGLESQDAVIKQREAIVPILKEFGIEIVRGLIDESPHIR